MKKKIYALTLFILVVSLIQASPSVLAATKNWGSSDGFWNNPNNWFPFGIPGIGDDVIVNPYGGYVFEVRQLYRFGSFAGDQFRHGKHHRLLADRW